MLFLIQSVTFRIMLVQALIDEIEHVNRLGDIPALFLVGIIIAYLSRVKRSQRLAKYCRVQGEI